MEYSVNENEDIFELTTTDDDADESKLIIVSAIGKIK